MIEAGEDENAEAGIMMGGESFSVPLFPVGNNRVDEVSGHGVNWQKVAASAPRSGAGE